MDFEEILHRAKFQGELEPEEVEAAADVLRRRDEEADFYDLIYIIGLSGDEQYRKLLEEFLYSPKRPDLASAALNVLCRYMVGFEPYRDEVIKFIRGVEWDFLQSVQNTALFLAGSYLREHRDPELLKLLGKMYREGGRMSGTAYQALETALADERALDYDKIPDDPTGDTEREKEIWRRYDERLDEEDR